MSSTEQTSVDRILSQFDEKGGVYADFLSRVMALTTEFIDAEGLVVYSVEGRVMTREQLQDRLLEEKAESGRIEEVKDAVRIRIVTFFLGEMDALSRIICREFKVLPSPECSQPQLGDPERLGNLYSRCHLASLPDNRLELIEYKRFSECLVTFEIRTVLQHAWAEHNLRLGFRSRETLPAAIGRNHDRVAWLFSLADDELNGIMKHVFSMEVPAEAWEERLEEVLETNLLAKAEPAAIPPVRTPLCREAFEKFILSDLRIREQDRMIADHYDTRLIFKEGSIATLLQALALLELDDLEGLKEGLIQRKLLLLPIAKMLLGDKADRTYDHISRGFPILALCFATVCQTGNTVAVHRFLEKFPLENTVHTRQLANELIAYCQDAEMNSRAASRR